jgi:MFS family permease
MEFLLNNAKNRQRIIVQGVTLAGALAVAEQSVVLPVIVKFFSNSNAIVGIFASLLRGGAIMMQLYAAFHARSDAFVLKKMVGVFYLRFFSWFSIGLVIFLFGASYPALTLVLFSISLFTFSFSAGFGAIYYQELMGKMFTREYRGKLIADRQIYSGLLAIISVLGVSGYILEHFKAPYSFSYLFFISSLIMGVGFLYFAPFQEMGKKVVDNSLSSFSTFIKSALKYVRDDKQLRIQIIGRFLSYGFMLLLPFIILQAKARYQLSGKEIAYFAAIQMFGAMLGNIVWGKLASKGKDKLIALISFAVNIFAFALVIFFPNYYVFYFVFFMLGGVLDGYVLSFNNLLLFLAPEQHRPAYVAINNNITALGLFFSIPGGIILDHFGFLPLGLLAIILLIGGFIASLKL